MIENKVCMVSNYATDALQNTLTRYAQNGYKLVSTTLAKNKYNVYVMYLFFVKEYADALDSYTDEGCPPAIIETE